MRLNADLGARYSVFFSCCSSPPPSFSASGASADTRVVISNSGPTSAGAVDTTLQATNARRIRIPWGGRASPYPSSLYVTGVPGQIQDITVTLHVVSHTYSADIVALLVGPNGQTVVLMANAGAGTDAQDVTLTINDAGASMPIADPLSSTVVYRPTYYGLGGDLPSSAPEGPYGGSLGVFGSASPNGAWHLYVYDSVGSDSGNIWGGWSLEVTARTTDTVTLTDTLPTGLTGVGVTGVPPAGWACAVSNSSIACDVESVAVNEMITLTVAATAPITGGVITNTVVITTTTYDPDPSSNTAVVTTTVVPVADLEIVKLATPAGNVGVGQPLTYTLVVSNTGPSPVMSAIVVRSASSSSARCLSVVSSRAFSIASPACWAAAVSTSKSPRWNASRSLLSATSTPSTFSPIRIGTSTSDPHIP